MMEETNGRVGIREVYELVDNVRVELGDKMDDLSAELKDLMHENARRDLKVQALELELQSCDIKRQVCIDEALDKHLENDHKGLTQVTTKVWVMWGIGIFSAIAAAELFIGRYITQLFSFLE